MPEKKQQIKKATTGVAYNRSRKNGVALIVYINYQQDTWKKLLKNHRLITI